MKKLLCILSIAIAFYSCNMYGEHPNQDEEVFELNTEAFELGTLQKVLDGYFVNAIAFDSKGNAWIGTFNQGVIRYNKEETVLFNSENSTFPEGFVIWDIAVDRQDNVWIGGNGLLKYDGQHFTSYNSQNTAIPEDVVTSIAVDTKNTLWLASCRFQQGGLVKFDGNKWTTYAPNNSGLPDNLINDIAIDQSDNIWLTVNDHLVKFSGNKWETFDKKDLGLTNFIFSGIQFNSKNSLIGISDHSFNNLLAQPPCELYSFDGKKATLLLNIENITGIPGRTKITIDHKDNVWCFGGGAKDFGVWYNKQLSIFNCAIFGGESVCVIKEDPDYHLWFGTTSGIYIR